MRIFFTSILFCLILSITAYSQPKKVYISIDVSISMRGDKYNLANYMVQMITALMDEKDELFLGMGGDYKRIDTDRIKRSKTIQSLQRTYSSLGIDWRDSEINDIKVFNKLFKNNPDRDQWFFIIGDGYWRLGSICDEFKEIVSESDLKVFFLETMEEMEEHAEFGQCLDYLNFVTQYRSSNNPQTIINNCTKVATSLFGVSNESASIQKTNGNCYKFTSLLPISKVYIVYQDEAKTSALPSLLSASAERKEISIVQSSVTTEKIMSAGERLLSGRVAVLHPKTTISANEDVELCFDANIDVSKLKIYPMVDVKLGMISSEVSEGTPLVNGDDIIVCPENESAQISFNLLDKNGDRLPASILRKTTVTVKTDNSEKRAKLTDPDLFTSTLTLNLEKDETYYTIEAECPGYFKLITDKYRIIKSEDCSRALESETIVAGSIRARDIMNDACIKVRIVNADDPSVIFNPKEYNLSVERDYMHLFKSVDITNVTDEYFEFCFQSYGLWCECFLPDTLTLTVTAIHKNGESGPAQKVIKYYIDKSDTSWFTRCKWVLFCMGGILLLILYLKAISKKKRLKKGSQVRYQYFGVGGIRSRENTDDLRVKGFFAWINRWFIPGTEKSSKMFAKAGNKLFNFSATQSNQRVEFPKSQYSPQTMSSIDFDRDTFESKNVKAFTMSDNTYIKITLPNGTGSFQFCYDRAMGIKDDVPAFRAFINFILILLIICELVMGYFLITSIF